MKLVVQIPCLNEAPRVAAVIASIPRKVPGIDHVEVLVIDDGSTDGTAAVARSAGVDHLVTFPQHRGLAVAFQAGLREGLRVGADIIVNTDADGQYRAADIPRLVEPIVGGSADIVIGDRRPHLDRRSSWVKRSLQRVGSRVVELAGARGAVDAASGFRALSREAALSLIVIDRYTYTVESTIQAGLGPLRTAWVPVVTEPTPRASRLVGSTFGYVRRNAFTIIRVFATYRPLRFFGTLAVALAFSASFAFVPFLHSWLIEGRTDGNLQSIVLGAVLAISSLLMFAIGVLGDLVGTAREISHRTLVEVRTMALTSAASVGAHQDPTSSNRANPGAS